MSSEDDNPTPKAKKTSGGDDKTELPAKRERKQTGFFKPEDKKEKEFTIKEGNGEKLGEIPNVHFKLSKYKPDDDLLVSLHHILYRRPGTSTKRKKDIFEFSGFVFEAGEESKEREKVLERLSKWKLELIHKLLDAFELPRGSGDDGKKEAKVERLASFLEAPKKMSDVDLAAKHSAKKAKAQKVKAAKTPKSSSKSNKKRKAESTGKKASKKQKVEDSADEEDSDEEMDAPEVESEEEEGEPEEKHEKVEKTKAKSAAKAPKPTPSKATPSKATPAKPATAKATPKTTPKSKGRSSVPTAADLEPNEDEASGPELPSDEELHTAILEVLKDVDVNNFNLKQLMKELGEKFGTDLKAKKKYIREVAIAYCQSQAPPSQEEGGDEATPDAVEGAADTVPEAGEGDGKGEEEENGEVEDKDDGKDDDKKDTKEEAGGDKQES